MILSEYLSKAVDLTIGYGENGLCYVEPLWRMILENNDMNITVITDADIGWDYVFNVLSLTANKINTIHSTRPYVSNWLYEVISSKVDPAMVEKENEFVQKMVDFIKANQEPKL